MTTGPKIVYTEKKTWRRVLKVKIRKFLLDYLMMKLNEQLVLGLVHSGYEPIAGPKNVFLRKTGKVSNWKSAINQKKIVAIGILVSLLD